MSAFHDVSFPLRLAFGASGGPVRVTHITPLASGAEQRNSPHAHSKRRYNAAAGIKSHADLQSLTAFFEARHGQLYAFRFQDPVDYQSCQIGETPSGQNQIIGYGDGTKTEFQLCKTYEDSAGLYRRKITKPKAQTVLLAIDGTAVEKPRAVADSLTGRVTFETPPPLDAIITAGFEFDVPVRFGADNLELSLEAFGAGELTHVPLVEVAHA